MKAPVYFENRICGKIEAAQEGMYTIYTVKCDRVSDEILRCYATGEEEIPFGIMQPEGDFLTCRKKLSKREAEKLGAIRFGQLRGAGVKQRRQIHGWMKLGDADRTVYNRAVLSCLDSVRGIFIRRGEKNVFLALPFEKNVPLIYISLFCLLRPIPLDRGMFFELKLDDKGLPEPW